MRSLLVLTMAGVPVAACASELDVARPHAAASHPSLMAGRTAPCQCRAAGTMWEMGAEVCLDLDQGRQVFVCGMDQNVTSWKQTGRSCPES